MRHFVWRKRSALLDHRPPLPSAAGLDRYVLQGLQLYSASHQSVQQPKQHQDDSPNYFCRNYPDLQNYNTYFAYFSNVPDHSQFSSEKHDLMFTVVHYTQASRVCWYSVKHHRNEWKSVEEKMYPKAQGHMYKYMGYTCTDTKQKDCE